MNMNYNTAWTISSVAKFVTQAIEKTGTSGVYILAAGVVGGAYLGWRKIHDLENRVNQLEWQVKFGGK